MCSNYIIIGWKQKSKPNLLLLAIGLELNLIRTTRIFFVFFRVTLAVVKRHDQSCLRRKWLTWLTLPYQSSSLKAVRRETQSGQQPEDRSWRTGHGEVLLTGLLLMASSVCILIETRTSRPEWYNQPWAKPLPSITNLKKCLTTGSSGDIFSSEVLFFQIFLTFVKLA